MELGACRSYQQLWRFANESRRQDHAECPPRIIRHSTLTAGMSTPISSSLTSLSALASLMPSMASLWYVDTYSPLLRRVMIDGSPQSTSEEAAKDIAAFVAIFFEHFSQFKGREFHMAGESYGVGLLTYVGRISRLTGPWARRVDTSPLLLLRSTIRTRSCVRRD